MPGVELALGGGLFLQWSLKFVIRVGAPAVAR